VKFDALRRDRIAPADRAMLEDLSLDISRNIVIANVRLEICYTAAGLQNVESTLLASS
jgi:hypothetical protein